MSVLCELQHLPAVLTHTTEIHILIYFRFYNSSNSYRDDEKMRIFAPDIFIKMYQQVLVESASEAVLKATHFFCLLTY